MGSTFDITVVGFNAANQGAFLAGPVDVPFGTTQAFPGQALGGQTLTVTSNEVVGAATTTDTLTLSVPTNFDPTGTTIGSPATPVTQMFAEFGGYNAGTDTLKFQAPLPSPGYTDTGFMLYAGGTLPLSPMGNDQLSNGNMSLASAEGVAAGGADLAQFGITQFTFQISYPNPVPEPGTLTLCGLTIAGIPAWRRRRTAVCRV